METVKADRGRIVVQVTASGTVSALKTVLVGSQVSGRVAELHADFNDPVKKGQLLARLDTQLFQSAVEQARASAAVARSNVTRAAGAAARGRAPAGPRPARWATASSWPRRWWTAAVAAAEVARAALAGARAQAQQAAASLRQAELNLAMTAIYSPIDGVVISRSVDVGQTVAASLQAPTIFTLAEDLRKMQVEAHVAEGDVGKLAAGHAGHLHRRRLPRAASSPGSCARCATPPPTVQNVVTYDAIVDVDNPELKLRPGMTANVTFVVADAHDVLRIPNAALRFRPHRRGRRRAPAGAPRAAARRRARGATRWRPTGQAAAAASAVRVGVTDGSYTELVEGDVSPRAWRWSPTWAAASPPPAATARTRRDAGRRPDGRSRHGRTGRWGRAAAAAAEVAQMTRHAGAHHRAAQRHARSTSWARPPVHALARRQPVDRSRASSWPSWARRARASRR